MRFYFLLGLLLSFSYAQAQHSIEGIVTDGSTQKSLPFASVLLKGPDVERGVPTERGTQSSDVGTFIFKNLPAGTYQVTISYVGYVTLSQTIDVPTKGGKTLLFTLTPTAITGDEVIVRSIRAPDDAPTTFTNLSQAELEEQNFGQDFPFLLNLTPSTVVTSDAGAGVGYTGVRIRGVDPTRINVTINGIPLNDVESQGVFWVNMPDFVSSVEEVQIQRGVGTSTNGTAAFGSSINLQTEALEKQAYSQVTLSGGSFNTQRATARFGTGLINKRWAVDGRLSKITSDGFIDRASSDLKSYYFSAGHYGKKSILKFVTFSGIEKTYQAWNGIPQDVLKTNRTFNEFTYDDQTDNYQQDHYQAFYSLQANKDWLFNVALHYTYGRGYFEEFREGDSLSTYNLEDVIIGTDTVQTTNLIRRRWLDNDFYGTTFSANYDKGPLNFSLGGGYNIYEGDHFGEVIWSQFASNGNIRHRYYDNDARKTDFNLYAKANYDLAKNLSGFLDLQIRMIDYSFLGFDRNLNNVQQSVDFTFFNPKAGVVYKLNPTSNVYASYSQANREPNRNDFVDSSPDSRPKSERLHNVEAGYRKKTRKVEFTANYYLMLYKDQLILTGRINDVGAYNRVNVDNSYRTGIELAASTNLSKKVQWSGNVTFSQNKIQEFTEFVDDYDNGGQVPIDYENTDISFSPNLIATSMFRFLPIKGLHADIVSKYVSEQYLDNTQSSDRQLDAFLVNDVRIQYQFKSGFFKQIRLGVTVNNILDEEYEPNGYTFSGFTTVNGTRQRQDFNFFYPQAGRNFLALLSIGF